MALPEPQWCGSEEDHSFRSQVIQWLLHQDPSQPERPHDGRDAIPRTIVQFWHDLTALPDDVEECLSSWRQLEEAGFTLEVFDDERARSFIERNCDTEHVKAFDLCHHPAMRCDYFRLCYILICGGLYVDADEVYMGESLEALFADGQVKLQPLCYDTATSGMVEPAEFLRDTRHPSTRIFYVNNNPLIAPAGHVLLHLALRRSTQALLRCSDKSDIQSITGPGNLSASLVRHVITLQATAKQWNFRLLRCWGQISRCEWFLSYRSDWRNWRLA